MIIPTTGIVFLFGAFVYIYLSMKFYQCYKVENNNTARLFSYSFFLVGLNYVVSSIPSLFLIENQAVWQLVAPIYTLLTSAGWLLLMYAIFSAKFPKCANFLSVFFFITFLFYNYWFFFNIPHYFFTGGTLNWEIGPKFWVMSVFFLPFILPMLIIFFQQMRKTEDRKVKIRSLGFLLALIWLLFGASTDFFLITLLKVNPVYSDLNYFMMFLTLAITLIMTWFPPKPKWIKKIE